MAEYVYAFEVGAGDISLRTNRLSRAYALLNTRRIPGREYGFEYKFFRDYNSQVEKSTILSNTNDNIGIKGKSAVAVINNSQSSSNIDNIILSLNYNDLIGTAPVTQSTAGKYHQSIGKILQGFAICESTESLSILLNELSNATSNIGAVANEIRYQQIAGNINKLVVDIVYKITGESNTVSHGNLEMIFSVADSPNDTAIILDKVNIFGIEKTNNTVIDKVKIASSISSNISNYEKMITMMHETLMPAYIDNNIKYSTHNNKASIVGAINMILDKSNKRMSDALYTDMRVYYYDKDSRAFSFLKDIYATRHKDRQLKYSYFTEASGYGVSVELLNDIYFSSRASTYKSYMHQNHIDAERIYRKRLSLGYTTEVSTNRKSGSISSTTIYGNRLSDEARCGYDYIYSNRASDFAIVDDSIYITTILHRDSFILKSNAIDADTSESPAFYVNQSDDIFMTGVNFGDNQVHEWENQLILSHGKKEQESSVSKNIESDSRNPHLLNYQNDIIFSQYGLNNIALKEVLESAINISKNHNCSLLHGFKVMQYLLEYRKGTFDNALINTASIPLRKAENFANTIISDWNTEWSQLTNTVVNSKDRFDRIKIPEDYDYRSNFIDKVIDKDTGEIINGTINENGEVEVAIPISHYSPMYNQMIREKIPVHLYVYKDTMLLIWIFWCKHVLSEKMAAILKEFYETEDLDKTRLNEFSKIVQMNAARGLNYVLDNVDKWINNTIAIYDSERMSHYERVMKQARWFGEKIAIEMSKFIVVKEYEPIPLDISQLKIGEHPVTVVDLTSANFGYLENVNGYGELNISEYEQMVDGELIIEVSLGMDTSITVIVDGEQKTYQNMSGVYRAENPGNSSFIKPAIKIKLQAGIHDVKILLEGKPSKALILGVFITNGKYKGFTTRYDSKPGTGAKAVDRLLQMMMNYYELHHAEKAKGERDLWTPI